MHKQERGPRFVTGGAIWGKREWGLYCDAVGPLARSVLGRVNLLPCLAAEDADEAAYRVRLPIRDGHI